MSLVSECEETAVGGVAAEAQLNKLQGSEAVQSTWELLVFYLLP